MPSAPIEVTAGVHVFTSRREHTTSTLVISDSGRGSRALLVDPAWDPDELAAIAAFTKGRAVRVRTGFATHAHHDHLLWHRKLGRAPRYASRVTAERAAAERKRLVAALGEGWPTKLAKLVGRVEPVPAAGLGVSLSGLTGGEPVELITHDAHLPGHTALWLPGRHVLIAGDMLSDVEPPLPSYDDARGPAVSELVAYLAGLDALAPYVARTDVLIPGHGHPTDRPMQRLDADRRHVDALLGS